MKSGHQKRTESKRKALQQSANAPGQRSLFEMFRSTTTNSSTTTNTERECIGTAEERSNEIIDFSGEKSQHVELPDPVPVMVVVESDTEAKETTNTCGNIATVSTSKSDSKNSNDWYRGMKLDVDWLLDAAKCLVLKKEIKDKRKRPTVTCLLCNKYEFQVRKMTSNCQLPIANGVRVDGKDRLKHVVDHLLSPAHEEAERLNDCDKTWCDKSDKHPWVRVFKKWNDEKLQGLVRIAIDAYNDSQVETLSARSWPSRSLAVEHSNHVLHHFESQGWDADFVPFDPPASCYHYRDPMLYAEIRNIIAKQEMKKVAQLLKDCLCYSVQIDGSADKQQVDSKFITARYVPCDEVSVKTVFLGIASSDLGGAEGLLDSFTTCIENIGINTDKLVGVTTDGENANTGKNAGLWKLLQDYIGRDILTIWCVCHRSDLALESVQAEVPELTIWMSNVLAVATFFRTSPRRTKLLHKVCFMLFFCAFN
jgi:hypothetical protein